LNRRLILVGRDRSLFLVLGERSSSHKQEGKEYVFSHAAGALEKVTVVYGLKQNRCSGHAKVIHFWHFSSEISSPFLSGKSQYLNEKRSFFGVKWRDPVVRCRISDVRRKGKFLTDSGLSKIFLIRGANISVGRAANEY